MRPIEDVTSEGLGGLRAYWVAPLAMVAYGLLGHPNSGGVLFPALVATVCCGVPLLVTGHSPMSVVSITALLHALYYPVAAVLNLLPSAPGVYEEDLWLGTGQAMWLCSVGMLALAVGAGSVSVLRKNRPPAVADAAAVESVEAWKLAALVGLVVPLVWFRVWTGTYFHILAAGADSWLEDRAIAYGFVGYVEYVISSAVLLQLVKYSRTRKRRDLMLGLVLAATPVALTLPSGSRDIALRMTVPAVMVTVLGWRRRTPGKRLVLGLATIAVVWVMLGVELYRNVIFETGDSRGRVELLRQGATSASRYLEVDEQLRLLARRSADYVAVGRIVDVFPAEQPFRWLEDVSAWPVYVLPAPLRPETPGFDFRDSAALSRRVGFGGGTIAASTPSMVIGDLYSRFGSLGVVFGMTSLGALFGLLDLMTRRRTLWGLCLFGLVVPQVFKLPQDSVFGHFLFFTRGLAISSLLAWGMSRFLRHRRVAGRDTQRAACLPRAQAV